MLNLAIWILLVFTKIAKISCHRWLQSLRKLVICTFDKLTDREELLHMKEDYTVSTCGACTAMDMVCPWHIGLWKCNTFSVPKSTWRHYTHTIANSNANM